MAGKYLGRKPFFMAGNTYGGCGHEHRTANAAARCGKRVKAWSVWAITFPNGRWTHKRVKGVPQ